MAILSEITKVFFFELSLYFFQAAVSLVLNV